MGYHVIDPDDIAPAPNRPSTMRYVSEAAQMEHMGLRVYEVEPGEDIPLSGLHYHEEQEEAFYVVTGSLEVETPDRDYHVAEGQFFIAEPDHPHRASNAANAETTATILGMGAPPVDDAYSYEE
ncbi:cupin domain-containing protein [Salinadaptatus halalkaliphilus]|uniref:Cupin domain-containing protein n=1 Tax=Salinadaptatus halalkaliphilus TaxID=2419781 RepID=A0A4S3TFP6_9EURY|nr:cupin domain-containing protein [Salinadaptatus halalkaliphilus]THE62729.1 cupin domain-containing protein [Salinadaptatus halalkaliphilus]